jgi:hypothetical protein
VRENHPDKPYDDELGCTCGEGIPCACNDSTPPGALSWKNPVEHCCLGKQEDSALECRDITSEGPLRQSSFKGLVKGG